MASALMTRQLLKCAFLIGALSTADVCTAQEVRVELLPRMLTNEAKQGDAAALVDEQREIIGVPAGKPATSWDIPSQNWKDFPYSVTLDLGEAKTLASLWLFDTNGNGEVVISAGQPDQWREVAKYDCGAYLKWSEVRLDAQTRYLRLTRMTPGANFTEIAVYEHSQTSWQQLQQQLAEATRAEQLRQTAMERAREEALRRPMLEMQPYGRLSLVDEIDCAAADPTHGFAQTPADVSRVEPILGRTARVIVPNPSEAGAITWRIGKQKLLRPGAAYVLAVDYPEDVARSMIVINTGNETSRGFHTGPTVGDALHSKYVNSLPESINVPLSGRWETWSLLFRLHDRFPERGLRRGPERRTLTPEDGFDVTIAQFSAMNMPLSAGAAISRIRLFEVIDEDSLAQPVNLPPKHLPHRHLFWREEMADGVIDRKNPQPGIADPIEWYRHKAKLMQFLAIRTFSKDLLEFGACQHWDSTPHGGNDWVFFDSATKDLWPEIVTLMGQHDFELLPYYEYAGSKGYHGLGNQRRAKPLTRDDAYTHIAWIENSNADITDPETIADFQKMLDLTVVRLRDRAKFAGIWIRPRNQMPVSFSPTALDRFASEANDNHPVTRDNLRNDKTLYGRYIAWWNAKRQGFLASMRDYLRQSGDDRESVLFTGCSAEPGVSFATWQPYLVTDQAERWKEILARPEHLVRDQATTQPLSIGDVVRQSLYRDALKSPSLNWGQWEVQHAGPADDPENYRDANGILLTHAFNRNYTVADPNTMLDYRNQSGLAMIRHYSLNEHMLFDASGKATPDYFVCDFERAGPYCMMAEAMAMAHGDPTMIGYLSGSNFGRGFPEYVRQFNANFLTLPALPSTLVPDATSDREVVVRRIATDHDGSWFAVINTSMHSKKVVVKCDGPTLTHAVSGLPQAVTNGQFETQLYPCQLKSFHLAP